MAMVGEALGTVGDFISNYDPLADDKREAELNLVNAQIANLNANTTRSLDRPQSFNVPSYTATPVERRPSGASGTLSTVAGAPRLPTEETPTVTNPYHTDSGILVNPKVPDAAASEERYGDILSNVFGVGTFATDVLHNVNERSKKNGTKTASEAWDDVKDWWNSDWDIPGGNKTKPLQGPALGTPQYPRGW